MDDTTTTTSPKAVSYLSVIILLPATYLIDDHIISNIPSPSTNACSYASLCGSETSVDFLERVHREHRRRWRYTVPREPVLPSQFRYSNLIQSTCTLSHCRGGM